MHFFFLWNTKEYILKNVYNQTVSVSIDFHCIFVHTMEVNGNRNCLVTNILLNVFCVQQNKEMDTGLELLGVRTFWLHRPFN